MAASAEFQDEASANVSGGHTVTISDLADDSEATQTLTVTGAANTDVTLDFSEAADAGFDVSATDGDDTSGVTDEDENDAETTISIAENADTAQISLTLSNSSDVDPDSRITYTLEDENDNSLSAAFKVIDPAQTGDDTITQGDDVTAYQGETVTFEGTKDTVIALYESDGDSGYDRVARFSTSPGSLVNYDTSDLDGDYVVTFDGTAPGSATTSLTVDPLDMSVEADDTNITTDENVTATVSSAAFGDDFHAELYEEGADFEDDDPLRRVTGQFDGVGDAEIDLGNISTLDDYGAGEYVIRAVHNDSDVDATSETLNVTEAGDASVSFENSDTVYQERGDVAEFTVDMENRDDAYVQVGGQDSNFLANFTVEDGSDDDTNVTVYVNTNATNDATDVGQFITVSDTDDFSVANGDDGVTDEHGDQGVYVGDPLEPVSEDDNNDGENALNSPISDGSYNLIVAQEDNDREGKKILSLSKPSVDSINTWVYAGSNLPDTDDRNELINGLSQTDTVAEDDTVVVEAQISGIYGYLNQTGDEYKYGYVAPDGTVSKNSGIFLNVSETNTGPNTVADVYSANGADETYYDAENNTVYYAFQTGSDLNLSAENDYNVELKALEYNSVYDSTQNASQTISVDEQSMSITGLNESDVLEVEAGENATVTGETNLAPGTDVSVEVETEGQLFTTSTQVNDNGTFEAQFDLSQFDAGTSVSRVYAEGGDTNDEVTDVVLVESVDDGSDETTTSDGGEGTSTTTTTTEETTTTTEETTTDETTTTEDTTTTSSDGGIPGFGMAVSLVALVAAALLALRRSN